MLLNVGGNVGGSAGGVGNFMARTDEAGVEEDDVVGGGGNVFGDVVW